MEEKIVGQVFCWESSSYIGLCRCCLYTGEDPGWSGSLADRYSNSALGRAFFFSEYVEFPFSIRPRSLPNWLHVLIVYQNVYSWYILDPIAGWTSCFYFVLVLCGEVLLIVGLDGLPKPSICHIHVNICRCPRCNFTFLTLLSRLTPVHTLI